MTQSLDRDGISNRAQRRHFNPACWRSVLASCGLIAIAIPSSGLAGSPNVQHLTCTEEAWVEVQNVGERVEVKQHKPDQTYRAYLVIDRLKSRLGIASSLVSELVYARIQHADHGTVRTLAEGSEVATGFWAIDTKQMKALYMRAFAAGDDPSWKTMAGELSGKMVYHRCVAGWPAEMLKAR